MATVLYFLLAVAIVAGVGLTIFFLTRRVGAGSASLTVTEFVAGLLIACAVVLPLTTWIGGNVAKGQALTYHQWINSLEATAPVQTTVCERDGSCIHTYQCDRYQKWVTHYRTESYTTTETYVENGQTRTRQVRHIRWVPAAGHVSHFFDDDLVCASVGVHPGLMRGIEPFPTGDLQAYDPGYVAGWVVERYQIDLAAAADRARAAMRTKLEAMCGRQVPGDTFRNLSVRADWSGQTYKHILAPVWLLSYDYGRRAFQCAINGVTGKVAGEYPKSFWKIAFVALGILVLFLVVGSMSGR